MGKYNRSGDAFAKAFREYKLCEAETAIELEYVVNKELKNEKATLYGSPFFGNNRFYQTILFMQIEQTNQ